ncbi:MAG: restriction endonuclease, partial [Candidatus Dormiibacterota bacterium]
LSAALGAAYLAALIRAAQRRHLLEWTSNLRLLDANEFEWLLYEMFEREGYSVQKIGSQHHGDGNIDLDLSKGRERIIVQCKRWTAWFVPPEDIQRFAGTFPQRGDVSTRWFVTLSDFTEDARAAAERSGIVLIDGTQLIDRLQNVRKTEPCRECGTPMLLERSERGWWLRCPKFPNCKGKRDLSREPGRALDLLLEQPDLQ